MINNCSLICQCIINFSIFIILQPHFWELENNIKRKKRKKIHVNEIKETLHESKIIFRQIQSKLFQKASQLRIQIIKHPNCTQQYPPTLPIFPSCIQ